jgi:hypothetical protein
MFMFYCLGGYLLYCALWMLVIIPNFPVRYFSVNMLGIIYFVGTLLTLPFMLGQMFFNNFIDWLEGPKE